MRKNLSEAPWIAVSSNDLISNWGPALLAQQAEALGASDALDHLVW
jgi:hypothetical protein